MRSPRRFPARFVWIALSLALVVVTSGHAWAQDAPPVITGPGTIAAQEGVFFSVTFAATSVDPSRTVVMTGPAPSCGISFSSFPGIGQTTGTLSGTPSFNCAGAYVVTITANDGVSSTSMLVSLTIANTDRAPVVTAPATVTIPENSPRTFTVAASDPDGDAITSLTSSSNPPTPGSTFTTNASNTSGTFNWTPSFTAAGSYTVTFTASNALSGSAATNILVCSGCDRAPVVTAPASVSGGVTTLITFTVSAVDPDGDAIVAFTASGTAMSAGGTFTHDAAFTSGTFSWTPSASQAGTYSVTFFAANTLGGSAITQITVTGDHVPVVTAPALVTIAEGNTKTFTVSAADPDGDAITSLTSSSSPATTGSTFVTNASNTSGTFSWATSFSSFGSYRITFTAANLLQGSAQTDLTVCECSGPPVVTAPAVISSPAFTPIAFTVAASFPDADAIVSLTASSSPSTTGSSFTVGAGNTSGTFQWAPTMGQAGLYQVTFTATTFDGRQGQAATQIRVGQIIPARAFTTNSSKAIRLSSGKPQWCAHVEPVSGSFQLSDIQLGTVVLRSPGTGSVSEIPAISGKTNIQGDVDNNGIDDAEFCFAKGNLQLLFSNLGGHNTVDVTIAGRLMSGLFFEAPLSIDVNAGGGGNPAASITPNPLNPSGVLSFGTARSGAVRVRLFDSSGRLVRTVLDTGLPAGTHAVPFDAKNAVGTPLASGVYFFRVEAPGDVMTGRFVVAK